jgi:preprotein translocase subunit SecD
LEEHLLVRTGEKVYVRKVPDITISEIGESFVELLDADRGLLGLKFTAAGQQKIDLISKEHSGRPIAVFLDGKLRSAPIVRDTYPHGLIIANFFSREEAENLVAEAKK